jgi:hypothetical protein
MADIPVMGLNAGRILSRISTARVDSLDDRDIRRRDRCVVAACDPVLRASVAEAKDSGRESGDNIVCVCDTVIGALSSDECCQSLVSNTGRSVTILHKSISPFTPLHKLTRGDLPSERESLLSAT